MVGLIALAVLVGAFVQAVVGLGVGLITAPLVVALEPALMPSLPLWFGLVVAGASLMGERHHVDWRAMAWALPARIPGTVLGVWLVLVFSANQLGITVALMVLLAVGLSLASFDVPVNPTSLVVAGFTAGVTGTATSIGGPPIALLFQRRRPAEVRSTLAVFFFVGVLMSMVGLLVTDALPLESMLVAIVVSPGMAVGIWAGMRYRDRLAGERFRLAVLVVCALAAVLLLVKSLIG
ncbi:MAG: sulfite exporter TauE/SafE family protein [Nocardioides sp.]